MGMAVNRGLGVPPTLEPRGKVDHLQTDFQESWKFS